MSNKKTLSEGFIKRMMKLGGVERLSENFTRNLNEEFGMEDEGGGDLGGDDGLSMDDEPMDDLGGDTDVNPEDDTVEFGPEAIKDLAAKVAQEFVQALSGEPDGDEFEGLDGDLGDDLGGGSDHPEPDGDEMSPTDSAPAPVGEPTSDLPPSDDEEEEDKFGMKEEALRKKLVSEIYKRVISKLDKK